MNLDVLRCPRCRHGVVAKLLGLGELMCTKCKLVWRPDVKPETTIEIDFKMAAAGERSE